MGGAVLVKTIEFRGAEFTQERQLIASGTSSKHSLSGTVSFVYRVPDTAAGRPDFQLG